MERIKWWCYKFLMKFIAQPQKETPVYIPSKMTSQSIYQWVFCSTIGELNGCKPIIAEVEKRGTVILITDRDCYQEAYSQHFPNAIIIQITGNSDESAILIKRFPPVNFYMCEIPCLPYDAPCRLSYQFLRDLKKSGCAMYVVNGWLYGYGPSCKQDAIEQWLFSKDYVNLFNILCVQTESVKLRLIEKGADKQKIHVTGNMKFDAISSEINVVNKVSEAILNFYSGLEKSVIVAGCLSEEWEYRLLVNSFKEILSNKTACVLIFAPRHPEKKEQLFLIETILKESGLSFEFKSKITHNVSTDTQVLVLDTFGELKSFYSIADVSYMGRNHNVLEPIAFGNPVVILSGWETTYPSYPVYEIALKNHLVTEISNESDLGNVFAQLLQNSSTNSNLAEKLHHLPSALNKNIALLF